MINYTKQEAYILGQAYGIVSKLAKPNGVSTSEMTIAEIYPYKGFTMMFTLANKKKIPAKANKVLTELMDQLDLERMTELFDKPTPPDVKMDWHTGYAESNALLKDSKLKSKRLESKISQEELAHKIGCTQKDISRWETGIVSPTLKNIVLLSEALNCKIEDII